MPGYGRDRSCRVRIARARAPLEGTQCAPCNDCLDVEDEEGEPVLAPVAGAGAYNRAEMAGTSSLRVQLLEMNAEAPAAAEASR
jgi:hypothetical protein